MNLAATFNSTATRVSWKLTVVPEYASKIKVTSLQQLSAIMFTSAIIYIQVLVKENEAAQIL